MIHHSFPSFVFAYNNLNREITQQRDLYSTLDTYKPPYVISAEKWVLLPFRPAGSHISYPLICFLLVIVVLEGTLIRTPAEYYAGRYAADLKH